MKFKTVQEAFNYWNTKTVDEIEARAAAIKVEAAQPNADVEALNFEVEGLRQAKENKVEKRSQEPAQSLNPITGTTFAQAPVVEADICNTTEYRNAFFKRLLGQELNQSERAAFDKAQAEHRAAGFNTLSNSAAVIPTQTLNEIVKKVRTLGGLIAEVRAFSMPSYISIPVGTPAAKAAWHTEGAAVEGEEVTTASVVFNGYEILKVFSISAATKNMSIAAFESYLTDELAACVMETIADSLVNGTGSAQGTGILNTTGVTSVTYTKAGITYTDIVNIISKLKRGYSQGAKVAVNNTTLYSQLYSLVDGNKRPVFINDLQNEQIGKVLGFPVVIDDNIPDGTIIFGNFKYMAYNMPQGIAVEKSEQSSFKNGLIDYRAIAIADTKCIVPEAFVVATAAKA